VADFTGLLDLHGWPARMRIIVGPRSARTLALSHDSPTSTATGSPNRTPTRSAASLISCSCGTAAGLGARIRCAAPRTRAAEPAAQGLHHDQVWYESVALACELLALTQRLAPTGTVRRWEPKRACSRSLAASLAVTAASGSALPSVGPGRRHHRRSRPHAGHPDRLTSRKPL
jgi:hypothetical protein